MNPDSCRIPHCFRQFRCWRFAYEHFGRARNGVVAPFNISWKTSTLFLLWGFLLPNTAVADNLVETTVRAHIDEIQSQFTATCTASIVTTFADGTGTAYEVRFARVGNTVRLHVKDKDGNTSERLINATAWYYSDMQKDGDRQTARGGIAVPRSGEYCDGDPFPALLFRVGIPGTVHYCALEQLVRKASVATAKTLANGDVQLDLAFTGPNRHSNWRVVCVLSKAHNWLISEVTTTGKNKLRDGKVIDTRYEERIESFKEVVAGHFFPMKGRCTCILDGSESSTRQVNVVAVSMNQAIPKERLEFAFPPGVKCFDEPSSRPFVVDARGRRANLPRISPPGAAVSLPDFRLDSIRDHRPDPRTESIWRRYRYWLLGSSVAMAIGALALVMKHVRRRRATQ